MIKKLLFLVAIFCSVQGFSQVFAIQPPNLSQCNNEVFNLTVQTPVILGTQPQPQYTVTYYNLTTGGNVIQDPTFFVPNGQTATINAEVTNTSTGQLAYTSFTVSWGMGPNLPWFPNVTTCDSYVLPALNIGNYYTQPGGAGAIIPAGTVLTTSQVIYIFAEDSECSSESQFFVTIMQTPVIDVADVSSCTEYTLPELPIGQYYTGPNGTGNQLAAGTIVNASTVLYVYASSGTTPNCTYENSFIITIGNPVVNSPASLSACDPNNDGFTQFNLYTANSMIAGSGNIVTYHETMIDAQTGASSLISPYTNIVSGNQTVYARVTSPSGGCFSVGQLQLSAVSCGTITGVIRTDTDNNGCSASDAPAANVPVVMFQGNAPTFTYTNAAGQYNFTNVLPGVSTVYVPPATSIAVSPTSHTITMMSMDNQVADFCLTPIAPVNDVSVIYYSLAPPRPGLMTTGYLIIRNVGTTVLSGYSGVSFDSDKMTFSASSPVANTVNANSIYFNFANLQPSEVRSYRLDFMMGMPPTVESGNVVGFQAEVSTSVTDAHPGNNFYYLNQTVVNSYDPNDKVVNELTFDADNTTDNLHYLIRFQNMGTADAIDVRIEDQLSQNLDWMTFRPLSASHVYTANRDANGKVTFNFKNINLPPMAEDEAGSNGYVTFEVKLKPGLTVNHDIYNTASIFFDFNPAIVTNTVMTDLASPLGVVDFSKNAFVMYPNPASGTVNIQVQDFEDFSVEFLDMQGKKVMNGKSNGSLSMDVSSLAKGMYLVKVSTGKATETKKLIVK